MRFIFGCFYQHSPLSCSAACGHPLYPHQTGFCTVAVQYHPAILGGQEKNGITGKLQDVSFMLGLQPPWTALTGHPVVVQLSLVILLLWAKGLKSQLQFLLVQRVFDAQLLQTDTIQPLHCMFASLKCFTIGSIVWLWLFLHSPARAYPLEVLLGGLQEGLAWGNPHTGHVHVQTQTLLL